jgi:hypothetical protein
LQQVAEGGDEVQLVENVEFRVGHGSGLRGRMIESKGTVGGRD